MITQRGALTTLVRNLISLHPDSAFQRQALQWASPLLATSLDPFTFLPDQKAGSRSQVQACPHQQQTASPCFTTAPHSFLLPRVAPAASTHAVKRGLFTTAPARHAQPSQHPQDHDTVQDQHAQPSQHPQDHITASEQQQQQQQQQQREESRLEKVCEGKQRSVKKRLSKQKREQLERQRLKLLSPELYTQKEQGPGRGGVRARRRKRKNAPLPLLAQLTGTKQRRHGLSDRVSSQHSSHPQPELHTLTPPLAKAPATADHPSPNNPVLPHDQTTQSTTSTAPPHRSLLRLPLQPASRAPLPVRYPPTSLTAAVQDWQATAAGLFPFTWPPTPSAVTLAQQEAADSDLATAPSLTPLPSTLYPQQLQQHPDTQHHHQLQQHTSTEQQRQQQQRHLEHSRQQRQQQRLQEQQRQQQRLQDAVRAAAHCVIARRDKSEGKAGRHRDSLHGEGEQRGSARKGSARSHVLFDALRAAAHPHSGDEDLLHTMLKALQQQPQQQHSQHQPLPPGFHLPLSLHLDIAVLLNQAAGAHLTPPTLHNRTPFMTAPPSHTLTPVTTANSLSLHASTATIPTTPSNCTPSHTSSVSSPTHTPHHTPTHTLNAAPVGGWWPSMSLNGASPTVMLQPLGRAPPVALDAPLHVPPQGMHSFAYRNFFKNLEGCVLAHPDLTLDASTYVSVAHAFGTPQHAQFGKLWKWLSYRAFTSTPFISSSIFPQQQPGPHSFSAAQLLVLVEAAAAVGLQGINLRGVLDVLHQRAKAGQLPPELWSHLLPAIVRLLGRSSHSSQGHRTPAHSSRSQGLSLSFLRPQPAGPQHLHRAREQLLHLARDMAPLMQPSQVVQSAMQLVGQSDVPPMLHTFITGQLHGCVQHLEPLQVVAVWKLLLKHAMEATAAQQAHTAATHDSQEGGYISARSRSDAMRFEGGRDEMKGSAAAEERVDATAEEGDGFGMLEGLSGSVQRALPSLPAHEAVDAVQLLARAVTVTQAKGSSLKDMQGSRCLPDHLHQLVRPICALIRHRLPEMSPLQLVPLIISMPRLISATAAKHPLQHPQPQLLSQQTLPQQADSQSSELAESSSDSESSWCTGDRGIADGREERVRLSAGSAAADTASLHPLSLASMQDTWGAWQRVRMDKDQVQLQSLQSILRQRLHQQLPKCEPVQLAEVVGRLAAAATAKSTLTAVTANSTLTAHIGPAAHADGLSSHTRHSTVLAGGVDVKLLQAAAAAAARLFGLHSPDLSSSVRTADAAHLRPAQSSEQSPSQQQQQSPAVPSTLKHLHHSHMTPVVACDLARGFARLGLRTPQFYSAACTVVAHGVVSDVETWSGSGVGGQEGKQERSVNDSSDLTGSARSSGDNNSTNNRSVGWVSSGGGSGPSGLSMAGLVDLIGALAYANHYDALLLDVMAQRLTQELEIQERVRD